MSDNDTTLTIKSIGRHDILAHQKKFVAIASDVPGEYWSLEEFLLDLPAKWDLSFALWQDAQPIGYAILSQKSAPQVHLHHFMIARENRGQGFGARMVSEMTDRAQSIGANLLTLKVDKLNTAAHLFYSRNGFSYHGEEGSFWVMAKQLHNAS